MIVFLQHLNTESPTSETGTLSIYMCHAYLLPLNEPIARRGTQSVTTILGHTGASGLKSALSAGHGKQHALFQLTGQVLNTNNQCLSVMFTGQQIPITASAQRLRQPALWRFAVGVKCSSCTRTAERLSHLARPEGGPQSGPASAGRSKP